jgi:hypothetical protein
VDPDFGIEEATLSVLKKKTIFSWVSKCILSQLFYNWSQLLVENIEPCYMFCQRWDKNHYRCVNTKPAESQLNMKKLSVSKFFSFITGVNDTGD